MNKRKGSATVIVFLVITALSVLALGTFEIIARYFIKTYERRDRLSEKVVEAVEIGEEIDEYIISNL